MSEQTLHAPRFAGRAALWRVFSVRIVRSCARFVYEASYARRYMRRVTRFVTCPNGAVWLQKHRYGNLPCGRTSERILPDGTRLTEESAILEIHIDSKALAQTAEQTGRSRGQIVRADFAWLTARLHDPDCDGAQALVGRLHLHSIVAAAKSMGIRFQDEPDTVYRALDTFHRQLIIVFYAADWYRHVRRETGHVVEGAISLSEFRAKFPQRKPPA